jgi:hypothetical protein
MDKINLAYTKCAALFALSIVVTWVPSSANRVYGLNHIADSSFALNVASAAVLPLQGFWTGLAAVKLEYRDWRRAKAMQRVRANSSTSQVNMAECGQCGLGIGNLGSRPGEEKESTKEVLDDDVEIGIAESPRNHSINEQAAS